MLDVEREKRDTFFPRCTTTFLTIGAICISRQETNLADLVTDRRDDEDLALRSRQSINSRRNGVSESRTSRSDRMESSSFDVLSDFIILIPCSSSLSCYLRALPSPLSLLMYVAVFVVFRYKTTDFGNSGHVSKRSDSKPRLWNSGTSSELSE